MAATVKTSRSQHQQQSTRTMPTAYEQITGLLHKRVPHITKKDVDSLLTVIRTENGGTLRGYTVTEIASVMLQRYFSSENDENTVDQYKFESSELEAFQQQSPTKPVPVRSAETSTAIEPMDLAPPPGLESMPNCNNSQSTDNSTDNQEINTDDCPICMNPLKDPSYPQNLMEGQCGHRYHEMFHNAFHEIYSNICREKRKVELEASEILICFTEWQKLNSICPLCRKYTVSASDFPVLKR